MGNFRDRTGERVGKLTIIKRAPNYIGKDNKTRTMWECRCDCGNVVIVRGDSLKINHTSSCGCYQKERVSEILKSPDIHIKHGESKERLRNIWYLMRYRCENPNCESYERYGKRGIDVCDEWSNGEDGYFAFKQWALSNGYSDSLTIDRIDNNKGYSPSNCRWSDDVEQANNKRCNIMISHNGETLTVAQWARKLNISKTVVYRRLELGWDPEIAITQPVRNSK